MLGNPIFYLLFALGDDGDMPTSGRMVVSNVGPIANASNVARVVLLGIAALPLSLAISRITNGLMRPLFGWVAEYTIGIRLLAEALAILVLFACPDNPVMFGVLTGVVFFSWREIFPMFASAWTIPSGRNSPRRTRGFCILRMGSILGRLAAASLKQMTRGWAAVFMVVVGLDALAAFSALTALYAMRGRQIARFSAPMGLRLRWQRFSTTSRLASFDWCLGFPPGRSYGSKCAS